MRWLLVLCALAGCGCGDKGGAGNAGAPAEDAGGPIDAAPPDSAIPAVIRYPAGKAGLQSLIDDLTAAVADERREADAAALLDSLRLPDADAWFETAFGKGRQARRLARDYRAQAADIGGMAAALKDVGKKNLSEIEIERFDEPGDDRAVIYQRKALEKMDTPVPLYSVRFADASRKQVFHVWSFIHDGKTFRFVGKMRRAAFGKVPPPGELDPREFRPADAERIKAARPDAGPG